MRWASVSFYRRWVATVAANAGVFPAKKHRNHSACGRLWLNQGKSEGAGGRQTASPPRLGRFAAGGLLTWLGLAKEDQAEEGPESRLVLTIKRGILAAREGDLIKADQMFHIALRMAADLGHFEAETHVYCLLANTALERGLLGQAENLLLEVLKRVLADGQDTAKRESNAVVEISLKLANIYHARGHLDKARQGFEFCTKTQERKIQQQEEVDEDTLALFGMALDQLGQFCLSQGHLTEAEVAFRQAVSVARKIHGEEGDQTLVVLNSLASVLSLKGDSSESLRILTQVVEAAERSDSPHLITFLVNRGVVKLRQGLDGRADCQLAKEAAWRKGDKEAATEAEECLTVHLDKKHKY